MALYYIITKYPLPYWHELLLYQKSRGGGENSYRGKVRNSILLKIKYERLTPYYYRKVLLLLKNFHFSPLYKFFEKNFEIFFKFKKIKNGLKIFFFLKSKGTLL